MAVTRLHASVVVGTATREFDVPLKAPSTTPIDFGIDLPPDLVGTISAHVACFDSNGALGAGDGSAPIQQGGRTDLNVVIGGGPLDGGVDLAEADFAGADLAGVDLASRDLAPPGLTWTAETTPAIAKGNLLSAIWGSGSTNIYVAGDEFDHSTGNGSWMTVTPNGFSSTIFALWGTGANDIYAVGPSGLVLHYASGSWSSQNSGGSAALRAISGDGTTVYAVGDGAGIFTSTGGGSWLNRNAFIAADYSGVWAPIGGPAYVVGTSVVGTSTNGVIITSSNGGTNWTQQTNGVPADVLDAVWGSSASDLYVVGRDGTILHSAGNGTWTAQPNAFTTEFKAIWGSGPNDLYAVGVGGVAVHSTGDGNWARISQIVTTDDLWAVWGTSANNVYILDARGTVWHGQ